ncbi:glycosyltransferase [bacterium]|nr:glycosyltransferase [bacterium]
MIKVSIIVPVYNVEEYLSKCLDSLINQTLKGIEIICIDDGSTDRSSKILEKYANHDSRIKIINQPNQGVSIARNNGMIIAQGDYIGFCDSDDWVDPDFYEKLYNTAIKYDSNVSVAGIKKVKKNNKEFDFLRIKSEYYTEENFAKFELCDVPDFCYVWNKIYKRSFLMKYELNFKPNITFEDLLYTPQVLYHAKGVCSVPNTFYYYKTRNTSIVHSKCNSVDYKKNCQVCSDFFREINIDISKLKTDVKRYKFLGFTIIKIKSKAFNVSSVKRIVLYFMNLPILNLWIGLK